MRPCWEQYSIKYTGAEYAVTKGKMSVTLSKYIPIAEIDISLSSDIVFFIFVTPLTTVFQVACCDPLVSHKINLVGETSIYLKMKQK